MFRMYDIGGGRMAVDLPIVVGGGLLRLPAVPKKIVLPVHVGVFTCPATTGNYSVTGLGFRPKSVKFWVSKGPGLQTHFCCCQGMMDATGNQNSMTWAGVWSNIFKGDSRVDLCMYTINSAGTSQVTGAFVSMDADGFTVNFTVVNTAFIIRWEAIG